ncbi:MAG: branched-chain amino acid ABC transporter permease, partial [Solimonas sp.]
SQSRWRAAEIVFWLATLLPLLLPSYLVLASQIVITALFALSIDLVLGYAGIVTLGHAAFFGLGAYGAGLFSKHVWGEPLTGLAVGAALAAVAGYLSSLIVVRFRHLAIIMITLGFGFLLHEAANKAHWLTGGTDGLQGVRMWPIFGLFPFDLWGYTAYTYSLIALFAVFLVVRRVIHSPFGLSLRGIRENWTRMPAIGAPSQSHLRKVYTISAGVAGIAGALLAQTTETVSLAVLSFERSADTVVMLVLGGTGSLYGGLIGSIIFMVARDDFSDINPQLWYLPIGLLLVLVVLFLPGGVLSAPGRIQNAWRRAQTEGRQIEFILRFAGNMLVAISFLWWLRLFARWLFDLSRTLTSLRCLATPCEVVSAGSQYRLAGMWIGLICLTAGLLIAAHRGSRGDLPRTPVSRGTAS